MKPGSSIRWHRSTSLVSESETTMRTPDVSCFARVQKTSLQQLQRSASVGFHQTGRAQQRIPPFCCRPRAISQSNLPKPLLFRGAPEKTPKKSAVCINSLCWMAPVVCRTLAPFAFNGPAKQNGLTARPFQNLRQPIQAHTV